MKSNFIVSILITASLFGCDSKQDINKASRIKADWISQDKDYFLFIEDSLMMQTMIESSEFVVKYKISEDTLSIYSKDSEDYSNMDRKNLIWKYKILNIDSINLTLFRFFPQPYDTLKFYKAANYKRNNLDVANLELSASACFGHCPVINLKINKDSTIYQFGHHFTQHLGLHKYKLNPLEYKRIKTKLQAIPLDSLSFSQPGPDAQYYDLSVYSDNNIVNINGNLEWSSHHDIKAFIFYLLHLDRLLDLKSTNDSISFKNKDNFERYIKN